MAFRPDAGLRARAAAAHELLAGDPGLEQAVPRGGWSDADRERVFALSAAGLNGYEIARELGRPRSTVAQILRDGQTSLEQGRAA